MAGGGHTGRDRDRRGAVDDRLILVDRRRLGGRAHTVHLEEVVEAIALLGGSGRDRWRRSQGWGEPRGRNYRSMLYGRTSSPMT